MSLTESHCVQQRISTNYSAHTANTVRFEFTAKATTKTQQVDCKINENPSEIFPPLISSDLLRSRSKANKARTGCVDGPVCGQFGHLVRATIIKLETAANHYPGIIKMIVDGLVMFLSFTETCLDLVIKGS